MFASFDVDWTSAGLQALQPEPGQVDAIQIGDNFDTQITGAPRLL